MRRAVMRDEMDSLSRTDAEGGLDIDPTAIARSDRYKLLCGLVVPRPVALVTSISEDGVVNAAPFSFFNAFSEEPPVTVLGVNSKPDGSPKDTSRNIRATGEYVIHLVSDDLAQAMNICAVDFPAEMSEIDMAGFTLKPSRSVKPPTIVEAPVALECRLMSIVPVSSIRNLVIGEILRFKARPEIVDPAKLYVDIKAYRPVARLFGNLYARLGETYELKRQTYAEWLATKESRRD
jgi:flavin reductase (DIM6/NTAB) family NADH-FMN oxidoreductase RutF